MGTVANPHNGFKPRLHEIVRVVGACHLSMMEQLAVIAHLEDTDCDVLFHNKSKEEWLYTTSNFGGFEPVDNKAELDAFVTKLIAEVNPPYELFFPIRYRLDSFISGFKGYGELRRVTKDDDCGITFEMINIRTEAGSLEDHGDAKRGYTFLASEIVFPKE